MKNDIELAREGLTQSGILRYKTAVQAFTDSLLTQATFLGERDKDPSTAREVTHEHIRAATEALQKRGKERNSKLSITGQVCEYICTAAAGVAGGNINENWGRLAFGISLVIGLTLFVVRIMAGAKQ